jgi:hypothetical protein
MANETDRENPTDGQQYEEGEAAKKRPNPFGEQESQGNEQIRRAPGSEQEYQGNQPEQKRAPGIEEDDNTEGEGGNRKSA